MTSPWEGLECALALKARRAGYLDLVYSVHNTRAKSMDTVHMWHQEETQAMLLGVAQQLDRIRHAGFLPHLRLVVGDPSRTGRVPAYTVVNLPASWKAAEGWELYAR